MMYGKSRVYLSEKDAEGVLKIALCSKYQKEYSDIYENYKDLYLYKDEMESLRKWKKSCGNEEIEEYIIEKVLDWIAENEPERFRRALYYYNR